MYNTIQVLTSSLEAIIVGSNLEDKQLATQVDSCQHVSIAVHQAKLLC